MSRSRISDGLRAIRADVLRNGESEFFVCANLHKPLVCLSWEDANECAREAAYKTPGTTFRAEERRRKGGVVCLARCREWTSCGVLSMWEGRA